MRKNLILMVVALAAACAADRASGQFQPAERDVSYATVGGRELLLDLYLPSTAGPHPALVWVHGGGWRNGSRHPAPSFLAALVSRGFVVASVSYRLTNQAGQWGEEPVAFPAQLHDLKAAVRWLRAHRGVYDIDPARIGAWGESSGAYLATMLGVTGNEPALEGAVGAHLGESSALQWCVEYYGHSDFLNLNPDVTTPPGCVIDYDAWSSSVSQLLGWGQPGQGLGDIRQHLENPEAPYPELAALVRAATPLLHIDGADARIMIVHGTADQVVPYHQAERLRDALAAAGVTHEFVSVGGGAHGGFSDATHWRAIDFLLVSAGLPPGSPPPPPDPEPCAADLNGDGLVSAMDLATMLASWGRGGDADLNSSGSTGADDLAVLLGQWGACPQP